MSGLQRYSPVVSPSGVPGCVQDDEGRYVKHADAAAEITLLNAENESLVDDVQRVGKDFVAQLDVIEAERDRLRAWLEKICGGDNPCTDESQLRRWAYEAITLGREAP